MCEKAELYSLIF